MSLSPKPSTGEMSQRRRQPDSAARNEAPKNGGRQQDSLRGRASVGEGPREAQTVIVPGAQSATAGTQSATTGAPSATTGTQSATTGAQSATAGTQSATTGTQSASASTRTASEPTSVVASTNGEGRNKNWECNLAAVIAVFAIVVGGIIALYSAWSSRKIAEEVPTGINSVGQPPISVISEHFGACLFNATAAIGREVVALLPPHHINRTSVVKELDAVFTRWKVHPSQFVVALGAKGTGKTTAIQEWLLGKSRVVRISAERTHSTNELYGLIGEALGCYPSVETSALLERVTENGGKWRTTDPVIVHVNIAAGPRHQELASINLINMARHWSIPTNNPEHRAFFILDCSPHAIDPSRVMSEGPRIHVLNVEDFTLPEANAYVSETLGNVPTDTRNNVFELVGSRPLTLAELVKSKSFSNRAAQQIVAQARRSNSASFSGEPRCVRLLLQGRGSSEDCDVKFEQFHNFPWLRYSIANKTITYHFHSTADHRAAETWAIDAPPYVPPPPATVWVQARAGNGSPFSVAPTTNDIDHLKKAIKPAWNADPARQASITMYAPDPNGDVEVALPGGAKKKYKKVMKQSTPLVANTEDTPYLFELPE